VYLFSALNALLISLVSYSSFLTDPLEFSKKIIMYQYKAVFSAPLCMPFYFLLFYYKINKVLVRIFWCLDFSESIFSVIAQIFKMTLHDITQFVSFHEIFVISPVCDELAPILLQFHELGRKKKSPNVIMVFLKHVKLLKPIMTQQFLTFLFF
jgi:hypothetical protein